MLHGRVFVLFRRLGTMAEDHRIVYTRSGKAAVVWYWLGHSDCWFHGADYRLCLARYWPRRVSHWNVGG